MNGNVCSYNSNSKLIPICQVYLSPLLLGARDLMRYTATTPQWQTELLVANAYYMIRGVGLGRMTVWCIMRIKFQPNIQKIIFLLLTMTGGLEVI